MGAVAEANQRAAEDCWPGAGLGDYSKCEGAAESNEAFKSASAELQAYVNTGRVLPLRFTSGGQAFFDQAKDACGRVKDMPKGRFATTEEIARLAPVIASTAEDGKVWYTDNAGRCDKQPYFENTFSSSSSVDQAYGCHKPGFWSGAWRLDYVCVPPQEPFGSISTL